MSPGPLTEAPTVASAPPSNGLRTGDADEARDPAESAASVESVEGFLARQAKLRPRKLVRRAGTRHIPDAEDARQE